MANGGARPSPLPACGERVRPAAEQAERREAGVRGQCRKRRPAEAVAPPSSPPPHPRLLRRLAAFGGPLPTSGERRKARSSTIHSPFAIPSHPLEKHRRAAKAPVREERVVGDVADAGPAEA